MANQIHHLRKIVVLLTNERLPQLLSVEILQLISLLFAKFTIFNISSCSHLLYRTLRISFPIIFPFLWPFQSSLCEETRIIKWNLNIMHLPPCPITSHSVLLVRPTSFLSMQGLVIAIPLVAMFTLFLQPTWLLHSNQNPPLPVRGRGRRLPQQEHQGQSGCTCRFIVKQVQS